MYTATNIGKNFKGSDIVAELPKGAGYLWLRKAFMKIYNALEELPGKCFILLAHPKESSIKFQGKELSARDINLTGALKRIVCKESDAIGFMYRDETGNKNILSFKSDPQDLTTGTRIEHLREQEFVVSELQNGKLNVNWDKIFI